MSRRVKRRVLWEARNSSKAAVKIKRNPLLRFLSMILFFLLCRQSKKNGIITNGSKHSSKKGSDSEKEESGFFDKIKEKVADAMDFD